MIALAIFGGALVIASTLQNIAEALLSLRAQDNTRKALSR